MIPSIKLKPLIFLLIALLIISFIVEKSSQNHVTGEAVFEDIKEYSPEPELYFCPRDNCSSALFVFMDTAQVSIHCALFDLDLGNIIELLKEKTERIDVKVVVDNENYKEVKGIPFIKQDTSSQFSHNKFCVVDNKAVSTGSFNPTQRDAFFNNNNLIIIKSEYLTQNYEDEFKELWNETFGKGNEVTYPIITFNDFRVENYFCSEDKCSEKVIKEIRKANKSIYFMTFSFTHVDIGTELVLKLHSGVDVKGIFEKSTRSKYSRYYLLDYQGADVKWDNNPYNMHHKVFIIDNKTVITGSFNPSENADNRNDENILIIEDEGIAERYLEEFSLVFY